MLCWPVLHLCIAYTLMVLQGPDLKQDQFSTCMDCSPFQVSLMVWYLTVACADQHVNQESLVDQLVEESPGGVQSL